MSMSPVTQPFHILRKDARHLWPETLISIALLVAFAWADVQTWVAPTPEFNPATLALGLLKFLIPVSWLVLASRLVHDEELVGDRQFWITRPYVWYSLLLSKVLYFALFVGVPFLIMQAWLLHHAGLYPTRLVPGLFYNLLLIAVTFVLPLLTLAAVTATFVRYMLSVLGGVIYAFAVVVFAAFNWSDNLDAPSINFILCTLFILFPLIALLLQYARRKTLIARLILIALPLFFLLIAIAAPANMLTARHYPDTSSGTLAFNADANLQSPAGRIFNVQHKIFLSIPVDVHLSNLSDKGYLAAQHVQFTLDGPNGFHYTSRWSHGGNTFNQQQRDGNVALELPENIWNQIHDKPVALHATLGVQAFAPGTPYSVNATEKPFPIPDHGSCAVSAENGQLECRLPFSSSTPVQIEATVHTGDCLNPGAQSAPVYGVLEPRPFPLTFSPLSIVPTPLSMGMQKALFCANTRTTFTPLVEGARSRLHLDIPSITLDPYARHIPVPVKQDAPVADKP